MNGNKKHPVLRVRITCETCHIVIDTFSLGLSLRAGTIVRNTYPVLANPAGTIGICFAIIDENVTLKTIYPSKAGIIMRNGNHDWFTRDEMKKNFKIEDLHSESMSYIYHDDLELSTHVTAFKDILNEIANK